MAVMDATHDWSTRQKSKGCYIVRSTVPGFEDRVRIGVAGERRNANGTLQQRLGNHTVPWRYKAECATHLLAPFEVVRAWALTDWSHDQIKDLDHCLYAPFLRRYRRNRCQLDDKSVFIVPVDDDMREAIEEVAEAMTVLDLHHAEPAPLVEIPRLISASTPPARRPTRR